MLDKLKMSLRNIFIGEGIPKRQLSGFAKVYCMVIGATSTLVVFYTAFAGLFTSLVQNSLFLCPIIAITFMLYPARKTSSRVRPTIPDWIFSLLSMAVLFWTLPNVPRLNGRMWYASPVLPWDIIFGVILILLVLEACRRTVGVIVEGLVGIFILYAFLGPYVPGLLTHRGMTFSKFIDNLCLTTEGIYGSLTGICATTIFAFIAFGVFLQATGGDKCFMNLAFSLAGKKPGGPAKVAVLSSGMMGMISGSNVANVVTTGSVTIPMMKKIGYAPHEAGAVEACASTGGLIMPPVMGAGAFLMAEYLGVPLVSILKVAFLPAVLFYATIWFFIDKKARKKGLVGMDEVPSTREALKEAVWVFGPIALLMVLILMEFSANLSAVFTCIAMVILSFFRKEYRMTPKKMLKALEDCAISMTAIAGIIAAASILVAIINATGFMTKIMSLILNLSGGNPILVVLIILALSYIMGMGMPVTSCYVILVSLGAAAMTAVGFEPINTHMLIFWCTCLGSVTPPVCVAAFVAAQVAQADPMKTGFSSLKMGSSFYIIPCVFLISNFLTGTWYEIFAIFLIMGWGLYFMVIGIEGYQRQKTGVVFRVLSLAVFFACFFSVANFVPMYLRLILLAAGIAVGVFILLALSRRKSGEVVTA